MDNWWGQLYEAVVHVGSATIAEGVIFLISATSLLAVLYLMRLGKGAVTGSADSGIRGKLDRVETLLNEIRSERLRSADESRKEIDTLKATIEKLQSTTA